MSATADWLESEENADIAFVLLIDGLSLGFTTHRDFNAMSSPWSTAMGDEEFSLRGGLKLRGKLTRSIKLFGAKNDPGGLSVSILDDEEDYLTRLMFGEARTDIGKTYLARSINSEDTTLYADDVSQMLSATRIYCGLETMTVTAVDDGDNTYRVARGAGSIFPRLGYPTFGRSHDVPVGGGSRPAITDSPTIWVNRQVGLYMCHRVDGVWTMGLPGSSSNDPELLWAGRLKSWDESGDGWIDLECIEITDMLNTTVGARMYEGTLAEGMYLSTADAEMQVQVTRRVRGPGSNPFGDLNVYETEFAPYIATLDIADTRTSHQALAQSITAELDNAFAGGTETYGPEFFRMALNLISDDGHYLLLASYLPAAANETFEVKVSLASFVWFMLGYKHVINSSRRNSTGTGRVYPVVLVPRSNSHTYWERRASDLPKRFAVHFDDTAEPIEVTPTSSTPFAQQTYLPSDFDRATTDGFLLLDGRRIAGVRNTTGNTFTISRELLGFTRGSEVENVGKDFEEFLDVPDNGSGPIAVRQVWVEPWPLGVAMLRMLCTTGTLGYNIPFYDTLPKALGLGFPGSLIDLQSWLELGSDTYYLVVLKPTPAATLIASALNRTGKQVVWRNGQLAVVRPVESADVSDRVFLTEDNKAKDIRGGGMTAVVERTKVTRNPESIINRVTLRYGWRMDGTWATTINVNAEASQSDHEQTKAAIVDAYGLYDIGGARPQGVLEWDTHVVAAILAYFSRPIAIGRRTFDTSLIGRLFCGAPLHVADRWMVNPATGTRGVTGLLAWAVEVSLDFDTGVNDLAYAFQPDAVTTDDTARLAVFAPSARVDETEYDGSVIETHIVNVPGTALNTGFLTITGLRATDTVVITKPAVADMLGMTYDAWSPWNSDSVASPPVPVFGDTWWNSFRVRDQDNDQIFAITSGTAPLDANPADALAYFQSLCPIELTGATEYRFSGVDSYSVDNRGGLSLIVEVTRPPSGIAGYDDPTKTLFFRPHEYSLETEAVDVTWFEDGDEVEIVDLSPEDPDAPVRWRRIIDTVSAVDNTVSLTTALSSPAWPERGHFVMCFAPIDEVNPDQIPRGAFIADEILRSTGNANNDANVWGGDPNGGPADVELEQDQPYRRLNNADDDMGTALSVHKLHELRDFLNTAMVWNTRPVFINEIFLQPATHSGDGSASVTLVPPIFIPLVAGATRQIEVRVLAAMNTGTDGGATVRFMTSTSTPSDDQDFGNPTYQDGANYVDITVPETTTYAWYTAILAVPAVRPGPVKGAYATLDVILEDAANGRVNVAGYKVSEAPPA